MPNDSKMLPAQVGAKVGHDLSLTDGGVIMPERLGDMIEFAQVMCKADVAIPKHLRGNPGACLAVAMRARAWRMDPFAVATKTYAVNDILAYESQLVTSVINRHAPIKGRLVPRYVGAGPDRQCILEPETHDGQLLPYESPKVKDIGVKNSPLWKNDPDQQLFYSSARAWARRYFPELLLGVYDPEEARTMRDVTPREEQRVDNFLEDDTPSNVAEEINMDPGAVNVITPEQIAVNLRNSLNPGSAKLSDYDPETGEIEEGKAEPVPVEVQVANMIKAAKSWSSATLLEQWLEDSRSDLAALPEAARAEIQNAINAHRNDLEGL
jgi:hypothetical protein